jgi:hypothetical protein
VITLLFTPIRGGVAGGHRLGRFGPYRCALAQEVLSAFVHHSVSRQSQSTGLELRHSSSTHTTRLNANASRVDQ